MNNNNNNNHKNDNTYIALNNCLPLTPSLVLHHTLPHLGPQPMPVLDQRTRCSHGRMDGWTDGWTDRWTDGWMDGWMDEWTDGRMDGWMGK